MLNFALMGAGRIGKMHANNIALNSKCKLSYIYDVNTEFANQIAQSTNSFDTAFSYGFGTGLEITLSERYDEENKQMKMLSFFINGRYLWGQEATYLRGEDAIEVSDTFPADVTFHWSETKTDLLQVTIGISFTIM